MSEMQLDFVCRMRLEGSWTEGAAMEFCKQHIEPDSPDEFYFPLDEGFSFSLFEDRLYLDYYFDGYDPYDVDIDITEELSTTVVEKITTKFNVYLTALLCDVKYKILYFHNGGCAGASEIE